MEHVEVSSDGKRLSVAVAAEPESSEKTGGFHWKRWLVAIAFTLLVAFVIPEVRRSVVTIEVVAVPKSLSESGYSELSISRRVAHILDDRDEEVVEISSTGRSRSCRGADEREFPNVEGPGTKLSNDDVVSWLRTLFHNPPATVKIAVGAEEGDLTAVVWVTTRDGFNSTRSIRKPAGSFDRIVEETAEGVITAIDPSKFALYLSQTQGRQKEVEPVLQRCVDTLSTDDKVRCLTTWGDILFDGTHLIAATAKYQEGLAWKPAAAAALSGRGSVAAFSGDTRKASELFAAALAANASLRSVHLNRSSLASYLGDMKLAEREARAAITSGADGAPGLVALSSLLARTGRGNDAMDAVIHGIRGLTRRGGCCCCGPGNGLRRRADS